VTHTSKYIGVEGGDGGAGVAANDDDALVIECEGGGGVAQGAKLTC